MSTQPKPISNLTKKQRLEKVQASLYRISEIVLTITESDDLFVSIHNIVNDLMAVSGFYIALYTVDKSLYFPYSSGKYSEAEIRQHGLTQYILNSGEPLLISPRSTQMEVSERLLESGVEQSGLASIIWLGVPVKVHDETIGALVVESDIPGNRYGKEEQQLLMFVSKQIALLIQRERDKGLLEKTQTELETKLKEKTSELMAANKRLTREIAKKQQGQDELKHPQQESGVSDDAKSADLRLKKECTGRQKVEEAFRKEKQLLLSFTDAVTGLLLSSDFKSGINKALEKLGTAADVDRIYIFENHLHSETFKLLMSLRFEWNRGPVESQIDNPDLQSLPYHPKFSRWHKMLSSNRIIRGLVKEFPLIEREMLQSQGIISILIVPVIIHKDFWGFIGFDDCYRTRQWREEDDAILLAMAGSIGGVIARQRAEKALKQNNRNFALLNHMHSLFQARHTEKDSYGILRNIGRLLFPDDSGSVYIMNDSQTLLKQVASWGESLFQEELFDIDKYLALKEAQERLVEASTIESSHRYLHEASNERFLFAPISTSGEMQGMLQIHIEQWYTIPSQEERERIAASKWMLATRIVEHYSLYLVNLRLRERLQKEAIRDPLTGLYNRRHMEASLEREALRTIRKNNSLGIIMFDLDHFKLFNDTYGHEAGDLVLQSVGETIVDNIRGEDIACRYGGEEFLVILPDASLEDTAQQARQMRIKIKEIRLMYEGHELRVTTSMGVAAFPYHSVKVSEVLNEADKALYEAKGSGRDQVVIAQGTKDIIAEVVAELMSH